MTPVIALVGGVGSGKTSVARWLSARHQVYVIDADRIGHKVLTIPNVKSQLQTQFGNSIFSPDGEIDRASLGRLVFGPSEDRQRSRIELEKIVHPEIKRSIQQEIAKARAISDVKLIMLDAAVLLESGWDDVCDITIFVDVPDEMRLRRVIENRGWSEQQFREREASQLPLSVKKQKCDHVIDNSHQVETAGLALESILESTLASD